VAENSAHAFDEKATEKSGLGASVLIVNEPNRQWCGKRSKPSLRQLSRPGCARTSLATILLDSRAVALPPQQRAWVLPAPSASAFHQAVHKLKLARIERAETLRLSAHKTATMQAIHVGLTQRIRSEAKSAPGTCIGAAVLRPGPRPIFWPSDVERKSKAAAISTRFYDNTAPRQRGDRPAQ